MAVTEKHSDSLPATDSDVESKKEKLTDDDAPPEQPKEDSEEESKGSAKDYFVCHS
jgi:hypothetical protein